MNPKISQDYYRIEQALGYLEENFNSQPELKEIAENIHLSEFHFQRLFSRWVGISPKRFLQFLTKEYAKRLLQESANLLEATFDSGLSSPGRLHDLFVTCEAVTPGEYKSGGNGLVIHYGIHPSPFGDCLLALTERGICGLHFISNGNHELLIQNFHKEWPRAAFTNSPDKTAPVVNQIFSPDKWKPNRPLHLLLKGTNFQIKVWEALLKIPLGTVVSYEDIARLIGKPSASRAVGNAVGANPIPFLIPCHRVIKKIGEFGNYSEGPLRKKAILGWEAAKIAVAE
jgi:AraC family transcriptional regulator of adaptative response/methylated-DNA-[protein]-cysteine methyltransferase